MAYGSQLLGVVRMTRAFLPILLSQPAAHITNISSIFGIVSVPGQTAYCASKFAVRGFSNSLRYEMKMLVKQYRFWRSIQAGSKPILRAVLSPMRR